MASDWRRTLTDEGKQYFFNIATDEVKWKAPEGVDVEAIPLVTKKDRKHSPSRTVSLSPAKASAAAAASAISPISSLLHELKAECGGFIVPWNTVVEPCTVATSSARESEWELRHTESSGVTAGEAYYVNKLTGESVWEKPDEPAPADQRAGAIRVV